MTDYLNPDKLYPDDISRRIDTPPGFDSVRVSTGFQWDGGDKTERRCRTASVPKSVKQKFRNLHSETAEICTLRCDYCGRYTKDSDLTAEFTKDKYLMCRDCKEKHT